VNAAGLISLTVAAGVPISIRRRGGRKLILAPDGTNVTATPVSRHNDSAMVKAIARAFRWRHMLENGRHATIAALQQVVYGVIHDWSLPDEIYSMSAVLRLRRPARRTRPVEKGVRPWGEEPLRICQRGTSLLSSPATGHRFSWAV